MFRSNSKKIPIHRQPETIYQDKAKPEYYPEEKIGMLTEYYLTKYALSPQMAFHIGSPAVGGAIGGAIGSKKHRVRNALIGAGAGAGLGLGVGHGTKALLLRSAEKAQGKLTNLALEYNSKMLNAAPEEVDTLVSELKSKSDRIVKPLKRWAAIHEYSPGASAGLAAGMSRDLAKRYEKK